jgi:hypothetical protein
MLASVERGGTIARLALNPVDSSDEIAQNA